MVLKLPRQFSLYKPHLKALSRNLRKNSTLGEIFLWQKLKGKQLLGYKFIRQIPIINYIVDFFCAELQLIIEIDGFSHDVQLDYDERRQQQLEQAGFTVLRFQEREVRQDIDNVIQRIVDWIEPRKGLTPPLPPSRGERERL